MVWWIVGAILAALIFAGVLALVIFIKTSREERMKAQLLKELKEKQGQEMDPIRKLVTSRQEQEAHLAKSDLFEITKMANKAQSQYPPTPQDLGRQDIKKKENINKIEYIKKIDIANNDYVEMTVVFNTSLK